MLLSAADVQQCSKGSLKVCPTNIPLYDAKMPSCEASLFFQTPGDGNRCKRSLLLNYTTPTLRKHDTVWVYHFPRKQQITIRCPHGTNWVTHESPLREWLHSQRHFLFSLHSGDQDVARTTQDRLRASGHLPGTRPIPYPVWYPRNHRR